MPERTAGDWPQTEEVIGRLRHWLNETRDEAALRGETDETDEAGDFDDASGEAVGLYQLVEQMTALRHEVKLLTKASRGGEERHEATLLAMQAAIEQFRSVNSGDSQAADQIARPLVEGLADLDESLLRGRRAIESSRRKMLEDAGRQLQRARGQFEQLYQSQPWWRRALCRPWHAAALDIHSDRALDSLRAVFDSLLEGYDLIQSRLQRTLDEQQIIRMQCVGRQVDPHCMTVVEAVSDASQPPGLVVAELRCGYYWNTKVLRFAEVQAIGER